VSAPSWREGLNMKCTDERIPILGEWMAPRDGSNVGLVVDVLLDGSRVVLARQMLDRVVETVHRTSDLKGLLLGRRVIPR
jgi:hypothetical protein